MYRALAFDLDGTIVNSLPIAVKTFNAWCQNPIPNRLGYRGIATTDLVRQKGAESVACEEMGIPWYIATAVIGTIIRNRMQDSPLVAKIKQTIDELHEIDGLMIGIISANAERSIRFYEERDELHFDFIYSMTDCLFYGKEGVIQRFMRKHKFLSEEVLYIGDQRRDILAARKAGIDIAAVTWGYESRILLKKLNPEYLVDTPREIVQLVLDSYNKNK